MAYTKKQRSEYNERRKRVAERMGMGKNEYNYIRRLGEHLHRAGENYANGTDRMGERYEDRHYDKDVADIFKKLDAYRRRNKLQVHFFHQSDPRGAALYISKERMNQSDYPSKGHAVY